MKLKYKIVEMWPDNHQIVVRYYTDTISEEELRSNPANKEDGTPVRCRSDVAINVPIPMPPLKELEELIWKNCPTDGLKRLEDIKNDAIDTSMKKLKTRIGKEKTIDGKKLEELRKPKEAEHKKPLTDEEIKKLLGM